MHHSNGSRICLAFQSRRRKVCCLVSSNPTIVKVATPAGERRLIARGARFWRVNFALFLGSFATFAMLYCVQPLMPLFARAFSISPAAASLSLSAATGVLAVAMIFAGTLSDLFGRKAIMTASLIRPQEDIADRFDLVAATWERLCGGRRPGFTNAVYLSERQTADRNFALGYSMRESGAFRPGTDLLTALEFYFQSCSIEVDAEMLATAAASMANAGVCPLTEDPVFAPGTVQSCLSLMSSCGMYDFSGEFALTIGLPAKSGVSGAVLLVVSMRPMTIYAQIPSLLAVPGAGFPPVQQVRPPSDLKAPWFLPRPGRVPIGVP